MNTIFDALADPTRRQILDLLRDRPRLVGELVDLLEISQPGVSKQLRVLREAGLVSVRQDAQRRWYELRPEPLAELEAWLLPYRRMMEDRFNRLENLLDELKEDQDE
ncbi:MAG: transcriptional regulator [Anaerolineaceae bacterium]|nr:transcriptional regulator [Anaerolineaceae bacterium]